MSNLKDFGFKPEKIEIRRGTKIESSFPEPVRRFRLELEQQNQSIEYIYFWLVGHARDDWGMNEVHKITDSHGASPASSLFGDMQTKLGAQQSNVSNYLATMGRLLKDLFKLVRELRQLDERLGYYTDSYKDNKDKYQPAETTLKDIWVTLVEGGTNNPASVYGMAQKVGFTILPDLFFGAKPLKRDEVKAHIDSLEFNETVKLALERKLFQFTTWKDETFKELKNKKNFQIRYLRQHFEVIRMYIEWIKPYLKNLQRLQMSDNMQNDPMVVNTFETSMSEIETVCALPPKIEEQGKDPSEIVQTVLSLQFIYRSKPQMQFHKQDQYHQRGPVHIGRTEVFMRAYAWTREELLKYKQYREKEALEMIANFDASVKDAMEYLGEDLQKYLEAAEADIPPGLFSSMQKKEEKKETQKPPSPLKQSADTLFSPIRGLYELFLEPFVGNPSAPGELAPFFKDGKWLLFGSRHLRQQQAKDEKVNEAKAGAKKKGSTIAFQCFKNFKKAHRMIAW